MVAASCEKNIIGAGKVKHKIGISGQKRSPPEPTCAEPSELEGQRTFLRFDVLTGGYAGPAVVALGIDSAFHGVQSELAGLDAGKTFSADMLGVLRENHLQGLFKPEDAGKTSNGAEVIAPGPADEKKFDDHDHADQTQFQTHNPFINEFGGLDGDDSRR